LLTTAVVDRSLSASEELLMATLIEPRPTTVETKPAPTALAVPVGVVVQAPDTWGDRLAMKLWLAGMILMAAMLIVDFIAGLLRR
jgi:hypothetical protein